MAKLIKGTKAGGDLNGTDDDDLLLGLGGDDFITGGEGDDDINGGLGIDTAIYSGNYLDYAFSYKDTGNFKVTVEDSVLGRDGIDQLKWVEFLQFNDDIVNVVTNLRNDSPLWDYSVNATLDPAAQDPPGDMFAGDGLNANNFGIARNEDAGIELGLKVHKRFDAPSDITTTDDYADGELHFTVDAGPGNPPTSNRAEWNFDFSIATGLNGATTDLSDFTFKLLFDVDKTAATNYRVLTLEAESTVQPLGESGFQWRDEGTGLVFIADDDGNASVTQNSENYGFGFIRPFIDDNPATPAIETYNFGPGEFDIVLQAFQGTQLIGINHIVVDVV